MLLYLSRERPSRNRPTSRRGTLRTRGEVMQLPRRLNSGSGNGYTGDDRREVETDKRGRLLAVLRG